MTTLNQSTSQRLKIRGGGSMKKICGLIGVYEKIKDITTFVGLAPRVWLMD